MLFYICKTASSQDGRYKCVREIAGHGLDSNFSVSEEQFLVVSEEEMQNLKWEEIYMGKASVTEKVLSYIEDHLGQELSLEEIARELNYSKYYVARAFKENTGMTLHKYIQGRRLSEAARKLAQTRQPIIEVAFDAGYGSQQAFTQAFHREYLCTPQEYRRIGRFTPRQDRIRLGAGRGIVLYMRFSLKGGIAA